MNDFMISIIIPVYNNEKYLRKCIESVIRQTYNNLEIILINDGSTDSSGSICDEYAKNDKRIKVVHKENEGQILARSAGIELVKGKYMTFVDADDYIEHDAYEHIIKSLKTEDLPEILLFNLIEECEEFEIVKKNKFLPKIYNRLEIENIIFPKMLSTGVFFEFGILPNLVCKMIDTEYWNSIQINLNENIKFGEDADMVFQILVHTKKLQIIDYAPYHYCKRSDSMTSKPMELDKILYLKDDLKKCFEKSKYSTCLLSQLEKYITFIMLLKCPSIILDNKINFKSSSFALYGAGEFGQGIYNAYRENIVIWCDQFFEKYLKIGLTVTTPSDLIEINNDIDFIFIAILNTKLCLEIKRELINAGVKKPILYYKY